MNDSLARLISDNASYYFRTAELKMKFIEDLSTDEDSCMESFEAFFDEFSSTVRKMKATEADLKTMVIYIICQIMGVMISKGFKEKDINSEMLSDFYEMDHKKEREEILSVLKKICIHMITYSSRPKKQPMYSKKITDCIRYIDNNVEDKLTLSQVSRILNYSASHLSHQFSKETGLSFSEYVKLAKIDKAKTLLVARKSIEEVSSTLNFSSASHFIAVFKKEVGITPKQFALWVNKYGSVV